MNKRLAEINKVTYQTLIEMLFEIIPEYHLSNDSTFDDTGDFHIYTFMNNFTAVLATEIEKDECSIFVINSFKFINSTSETNNLEVLNILTVGILEILYTSGDFVRTFTLEQLNEKNKNLFLNFSQFYS